MIDDIDYGALDPGIRDIVRLIRENGFETSDSGDGVSKPEDERTTSNLPHVVCWTSRSTLESEAIRLGCLLGHEWVIEASFQILRGGLGRGLILAYKGDPSQF